MYLSSVGLYKIIFLDFLQINHNTFYKKIYSVNHQKCTHRQFSTQWFLIIFPKIAREII